MCLLNEIKNNCYALISLALFGIQLRKTHSLVKQHGFWSQTNYAPLILALSPWEHLSISV